MVRGEIYIEDNVSDEIVPPLPDGHYFPNSWWRAPYLANPYNPYWWRAYRRRYAVGLSPDQSTGAAWLPWYGVTGAGARYPVAPICPWRRGSRQFCDRSP